MTKGSPHMILFLPNLSLRFLLFYGPWDRLSGRLATSISYDDCPEKLDVCAFFLFLGSFVSSIRFFAGTLHT